MPSISVIIPCLNEEAGIGFVLEAISTEVLEIIVVDNGSSDASAQIARSLGAVVIAEEKRGYGRALRTGFATAKGDILVTLDADNQYPSSEIIAAARHLISQNLDFLTCSRFPLTNKNSMSLVRRKGNHFLTKLTNAVSGLSLTDSQSGMMCMRREVVPLLSLEGTEMSTSVEMKLKAAQHPKVRYGEMHIGYSTRTGKSKLLPLKDGLLISKYLFLHRYQK